METDTNTDAFDLVKMGDSSLKNIEELFLYAREALMGSDFSGAYEMYRKIESIGADNEEVQLGLLRSKYHIYEIDQLFEYFLHVFENEGYKILEACPEDRFHINQAVNKYAVPGYFDEKQIEELCVFDRRYESGLDQRIDEQERFYEKIGSDSSYQWLKQNGSDLIKGKIEAVEKIYEKRITQARKEDEKRIREIENEYRRFLFSAYTRIREKSKKASECKEIDYRKLIKKIDQSDDEYSLRELVQEMESFGEYGEIKHYLKICRKKLLIVEERQEERIRLSKQLDQGERALSEGRYEEAERVFSDILSKYADHPYACLGLFMARNGLRNETKLFDYLAYMFSQYETETIWVCEDDEEHIDKVCMRYVLPDFLEEKEIWAIYQKGCSFESETKNRIQQKEEIEKYLNKESLIIRARENGDDHIMELFGNVLSMYDERIQSALKADEVKRNAVWDTYRYCIKEKDNEVDQLYRERLIKKQEHDEQCYQDNLKRFSMDLGIEELKELADRFDKDYKDGKVYIDECNKRIKILEEKIKQFDYDSVYCKGLSFLNEGNYADAKSYFEDCLRTERSNEGLHIHYLMACSKVNSVDRLFDHYSKLYSDDLPVLKQAIKEDRNHIDEICRKYYVIPEYIEADVIREKYHFDRTYLSLSDCRREQLVQIKELIEKDRSLSWLHVHGSKDTKDRIDQLIKEYENRLQEAIVQDEKSVEDVKRRYEDFLHERDEEIRVLFQGLLQKRDSHRKES